MPQPRKTKKQSGRVTPAKPRARRPDSSEVTSAAEWKQRSRSAGDGTPLEVPSGAVALVRNPGLDHFLKEGMIPNKLMPMVERALEQKEEPTQEELRSLATSPEGLTQAVDFANMVTLACVIKPELTSNRWTQKDQLEKRCTEEQVGDEISEDERDPDAFYIDEVDFEDRLFITAWAMGGTRDLESFRRELAAGMAALSPG